MAFYGDPDRMELTAARLQDRADEVRNRCASVRREVSGVQWRSAAGDTFRGVVDCDVRGLLGAASELDAAAAALRAHATTVRHRIAEIAAIERAVTSWFDDRAHDLSTAADSVADLVTGSLGSVKEVIAPWAHWPWQPAKLPPIGDAAWLCVAADLRGRGVLI